MRCGHIVQAGWLYSTDQSMRLAAERVMSYTNLDNAKLERVATPQTFDEHFGEKRRRWMQWPTRDDAMLNAMWALNEADGGHWTPLPEI